MNKDFIVNLLRKDIDELQTLTEGFEQLTVFPEPILRLAVQKAENIAELLNTLSQNLEEKPVAIAVENIDTNESTVEIETPDFQEEVKFVTVSDEIVEDVPEEESKDKKVIEELHKETEKLLDEASVLSEGRTDVPVGLNLENAKREEFQEEVEVEELSEDEDKIISYPIHKEVKTPVRAETREIAAERAETEQIETADALPFQSKVSLADKLQEQGTRSVGDNIANQKISDIRLAMNIGDRFRFQRELFAGNGEVMNKTIAYLNQLAKFEEAESFLKSKFNWDEDNPHAEEFLQLIRKRY